MSPDLLHAIASGLIIGAIILLADRGGLLKGRSRLQRFGIVFVIGFATVLVLNLIWPVPA